MYIWILLFIGAPSACNAHSSMIACCRWVGGNRRAEKERERAHFYWYIYYAFDSITDNCQRIAIIIFHRLRPSSFEFTARMTSTNDPRLHGAVQPNCFYHHNSLQWKFAEAFSKALHAKRSNHKRIRKRFAHSPVILCRSPDCIVVS